MPKKERMVPQWLKWVTESGPKSEEAEALLLETALEAIQEVPLLPSSSAVNLKRKPFQADA